MQQKELFERIFSDAHIVDIDLSVWEKRIALYVLADHVGRTVGNRLPMFVVEFAAVRNWSVEFNHLSCDPPIELGPDEHMWWLVDHYEIEHVADGLQIRLGQFAGGSMPSMSVVCEDVDIWEIPAEGLYGLFPDWSRPGAGFVRPGPDVLLGLGYVERLQGREYADRRLQGIKKGRR